jgi:hypothetical protein
MVCSGGSDNSADYNKSHGKYNAISSSDNEADVKENVMVMMLVATMTTNDYNKFKEAPPTTKRRQHWHLRHCCPCSHHH